MHSWLKMQLVGNRLPVNPSPLGASAAYDPPLRKALGLSEARSANEPTSAREAAPSGVAHPQRDSTAHPQPLGAGDFSEIYLNYFDVAWRALRRYGVASEELEDALQEVFLTVHGRLQSFEGRSSLRTWIFGIARRVARNHRPGGHLEICEPGWLDELPADKLSALSNAEETEQAQILYALLAELTAERREIVVLVELEHLTVAEAAEVLGENPNTLHSRLRAARTDLTSAWSRRKASEDWRRGCAAKTRR